MDKQFIPYELALELKELGFDEECLGYYIVFESGNIKFLQYNSEIVEKMCKPNSLKYIKAPLWQQAFWWFMDKGLTSSITVYTKPFVENMNGVVKPFEVAIGNEKKGICLEGFNTYDEALIFRLKKLIELYK